MQTEIIHEWTYEQPPVEVWEYLTQAELIAVWLMPNNFQLIPGHEFQFRINPIPGLELDGIFYCKVIEIIPLKKLSYSWKGGPGNGIFNMDTVCEWRLEPHGNGTKLSLKHSGFKEANQMLFAGMTDGWAKNIQKMMNHMNNVKK